MRKSNILLIFSTAGVAATAFITYKKASKIKASLQLAKSAKFQNKDANIELAKQMALPVIAGAATTACNILYGHITGKQLAAFSAAGAAGIKYLYKYRSKIREKFGKLVDQDIVAEIAKEDWGVSPYLPMPDNEEEELFYDDMGHMYFYALPSRVTEAMYHINRNLTIRGDTSPEEFYSFIGVKCPEECKGKIWPAEYFLEAGMQPWIDFYGDRKELTNGQTAKIIGFEWDPIDEEEYHNRE